MSQRKSTKSLVGVALRGIGMGAADVVPGVSGGTIAFITGIYEELLETIAGLNFGLIRTWKKEGFKAMWKQGNFSFIAALFLGIIISIASLAVLIEFLLENYTIQLWSFFFGLIIASVWLVGKTIKTWNLTTIAGLIFGTISAYLITTIAPVEDSTNLLYIFICGAIAVCAMILPGISGSFILLILGAYTTILGAVSNLISALKTSNWDLVFSNGLILVVFVIGCIVGLLSFSKLLNWLFKKAHQITIAILTGFLIGSLNKIWPWKEVLEFRLKHAGEINEEKIPVLEKNILPETFTSIYGEPNFLIQATLYMLLGLALITVLERFGKKKITN
jgi:putative membrane protein